MGLLSKFTQRRAAPPAAGAAGDPAEQVREARVQARRRLIGAALLLVAGIIGFPLLFETQPRPIPVDIPIEIPSREGVPPLRSGGSLATAPDVVPEPPPVEPAGSEVAVEPEPATSAPAAAPVPATAPSGAASRPAEAKTKAETKTDTKAVAKPEPKGEAKPEPKATKPEPKNAAKPLPKAEGKTDSKSDPKAAPAKSDAKPDARAEEGRFVVQIGAFAEAGTARDARAKVEMMGLSTYTQVIESSSGRRIRVRVGPFSTKAEADKAAARLRAGGLQAAVLKL